MHPACTGRKTGGSFVTGREQKACPFSESGGRYISPRPSSFVPRRAGTKCPKGGGSRAPKIKRGGQAPSGLARLDDRKARPGGAVNGGAPAPFILTIDGPLRSCYLLIGGVLCFAFLWWDQQKNDVPASSSMIQYCERKGDTPCKTMILKKFWNL